MGDREGRLLAGVEGVTRKAKVRIDFIFYTLLHSLRKPLQESFQMQRED